MRRSQSILSVGCCLVVAATTPLKIGVILGRDNRTSDTSDQEQWAVEQARLDVAAELEKSGGRYSIQLSTVFTGEDSESPEALLAVRQFLKTSSANGVGLVVGAYLSEGSLLAVRGSLEPLGLRCSRQRAGCRCSRRRAIASSASGPMTSGRPRCSRASCGATARVPPSSSRAMISPVARLRRAWPARCLRNCCHMAGRSFTMPRLAPPRMARCSTTCERSSRRRHT